MEDIWALSANKLPYKVRGSLHDPTLSGRDVRRGMILMYLKSHNAKLHYFLVIDYSINNLYIIVNERSFEFF